MIFLFFDPGRELHSDSPFKISEIEEFVLEVDVCCDIVAFRLVGQIIYMQLILELHCVHIISIEKTYFQSVFQHFHFLSRYFCRITELLRMHGVYCSKNAYMRLSYAYEKVHFPGTIDPVFEQDNIIMFVSEISFSDKFEKGCDEIHDIWFSFLYLENRERHPKFAIEILWRGVDMLVRQKSLQCLIDDHATGGFPYTTVDPDNLGIVFLYISVSQLSKQFIVPSQEFLFHTHTYMLKVI